jgi:hypothetical protein
MQTLDLWIDFCLRKSKDMNFLSSNSNSSNATDVQFIRKENATKAGHFYSPYRIILLLKQNRIFVCDLNNHKTQSFDLETGSFKVGPNPNCITIGPDRNLFVSTYSHEIKVFRDGTLIRKIVGGLSCENGKFYNPAGVTFDSQDCVLLVNDITNESRYSIGI